MALFSPKMRGIKILATICGYIVLNVGTWLFAREIIEQEKKKTKSQKAATQVNVIAYLNRMAKSKWIL